MDVVFSSETGLTRLLKRLGKDHPRYAEALTLQARLLGNIAKARRYGDTGELGHERAQIVDALNQLALETVRVSFNELCRPAREESVPPILVEPSQATQPSPPESPAPKPLSRIPHWTWVLLLVMAVDFCLIAGWGWCSFGNRPDLMAYLECVVAIVAALAAILSFSLVVKRPLVLDDALRSLGTSQGCRRVILGLSGLIIVMTPLFWPLGWVGKCVPTPTPTSTPTLTSTFAPSPTPMPTSTPTPTPTLPPTPTPDCSGIQVAYLELHLLTDQNVRSAKKYPDSKGEIMLMPSEIDGLSNLLGRAELTVTAKLPSATVPEGCTCYWEGWTEVTSCWTTITSTIGNCSFSIEPLPALVETIALSLTIGAQPPPRVLNIRVQR